MSGRTTAQQRGSETTRQDAAAAADQAPLRFVTAASLFDGHDAAINIMRRLIQAQGAEVVHLGHNRSVEDIVRAALQEDADGIACSSYQGGHVEYFKYMVDMLRARGAGHIRVFGGGGGTITPDEIEELEAYGVERIYTPTTDAARPRRHDRGRVRARASCAPAGVRVRPGRPARPPADRAHDLRARARRGRRARSARRCAARWRAARKKPPVVGITGTGGAGKSSVTDELLKRFLRHFPDRTSP